MMMRGVTIIIRLCVSRPMPTFLNSRLMYGSFAEHRDAAFVAAFAQPLDPAQQHGPAVRDTDRGRDRGEVERRQLDRGTRDDIALVVRTVLPSLAGSATLVPESEDREPVKVKVSTLPIELKNGTSVNRTKRRSGETTAWTLSDVPSLNTTTTG
jgi:hypothetical protein